MPVLGITGGIATGKTSFTETLLKLLPGERFDADAAAHDLLTSNNEVRQAVRAAFGEVVFHADGTPNRPKLREAAFAGGEQRQKLEAILHPAIRARWVAQAETYQQRTEWLYVDIPLLYETGAEAHLPRVVVVACSAATQRRRLVERRQLDSAMTEKIIGAQHDLEFKMGRANHVIWNDSTLACLSGQAQLLVKWLCKHYG